jgi:hypothetical protein
MTLACTRVLRICAMLALPASAFAQSSQSPTVFSPSSQIGKVNVRAAVVRPDYDVKPLPMLTIVARRTDRADSVVAQTDLDGRVSMSLDVGTYALRAKTSGPVDGRSYAWAVRVVVRPQQTQAVQLTNANASSSDSVVARPTVADAAPAVPAKTVVSQKPVVVAKPVATKPAAPSPAAPSPAAPSPKASEKVLVVAVDSARPAAPTPANPFLAPRSSRPARVASAPPRTNTTKLLLGLSFDASAIQSEDLTRSTESGAGLAAQVGWGFTKNFAMVLDASAARIASLDGDFDLAHVDVGGRWHFVSRSSFVPFVEVGYSGRAASKQQALLSDGAGTTYAGDLKILGGGASLGAGFQYFPMSKMAIGGAFKWTTGKFTRVQFDNVTVDGLSIDATSARFNMGFTWYPMARR